MANTMHSVTGTAMWAKVFEGNRDMHEGFYGDCGGAYTIDVLLDKEELDKFTKSGARSKPRITDDGISVKFKRKHEHFSVPALGGAPKVADAEGEPWDPTKFIGNGSKVEVWFDVYPTKMGNGTRLVGVKVLELEEFEGGEGSGGGDTDNLPF